MNNHIRKLNPLERGPGSDLDRYRNAILCQLEENSNFFLERFLEFQQMHAELRDIWKSLFIHITVEVVREASGTNRVRVKHVCVRCFDVEEQRGAEDLGMLSRGQTKLLKKWKKEHSGHVALGFAFDFKVYFPQEMVYFGVQMGLKLEQEQYDRLLRQLGLPMAKLRRWRYRIFKTLSDSKDPPPRNQAFDCTLDDGMRRRLIALCNYRRLLRKPGGS